MARSVALVALGVVVGILAGAALGIHAFDDGTADAAPPPATEEDVVVAEDPTPEPSYGIWDRLAACESTSNWRANTGNSYYGGLQEDLAFWRNHGGLAYAARPDLASRAAQIAVAERGLAVQGWVAWPACSRKLGLR
jgi:hypothetical protein